jgi:hypothetical protein
MDTPTLIGFGALAVAILAQHIWLIVVQSKVSRMVNPMVQQQVSTDKRLLQNKQQQAQKEVIL